MLQRPNADIRYPDVSPRTRDILKDERWYGNGAPQWLVGKAQNPAQTASEAHDQRLKLVTRLLRHGPETHAVADRLNACTPRSRCMSGACPECSRAFCRWFVTSAETCLNDLGTSISVLSLVHADLAVPVNELTADHLQAAKRKIRTILTKAGISTFIGGTDISANEHHPSIINTNNAAEHDQRAHDGDVHHHWQVQAWVFADANEVTYAERSLRKLFPRTESTPRPVKILAWNGDLGALGYALKNTFARRVRYRREVSTDGLRHGCWNTRDRPLRTEQQAELVMVLDRVGHHARLHLAGCRIVHTAAGPRIRMINGR
jgi:hypothetical protein